MKVKVYSLMGSRTTWLDPGVTPILRRWEAWTWPQVWRQNLGQSHQIRGKNCEVRYHKRQKLRQNPQKEILESYLKFKGQNLGYLSPLFWRQNL